MTERCYKCKRILLMWEDRCVREGETDKEKVYCSVECLMVVKNHRKTYK